MSKNYKVVKINSTLLMSLEQLEGLEDRLAEQYAPSDADWVDVNLDTDREAFITWGYGDGYRL